jgi:CheY-like chemotaxis protein
MTTEQPMRSLKVLIADDDQDDWYFAELAFKEAGLDHAVHFVKDGEELMDFLHQSLSAEHSKELPDLILLDLNMPKKDGRVALQEIRSDTRFEKVNVVIFSTCISEEDKAFTSTLGASRHVTKPFDFSELVLALKDICDSCVVA